MWLETLFIYAISLIAIVVSTLYIYFKYKYKHWEKENIPYLKPVFPFGNVKSLILQDECFGICFQDIYKKIKKLSPSLGGFYMFSKPAIMVIDPELNKNILTKDFGFFHDRGMFLDEENDPLNAHLVALKGLQWKTSRAKITPTFTSGKMKIMFHTMLSCSKRLSPIMDEHIKSKTPLDIKEIFARLSTDIIASCAFGLECDMCDNEFRQFGKKIFAFHFREAFFNAIATNFPQVLRFLKISQTRPDVTEFFMNVLKQTVEYREKNNIHRKDFLDLLIRLKNNQSVLDDSEEVKDNETGITFNQLAAHAFVFFAAGFETISSTLNFCLFELSSNEKLQEKLREEVVHINNKYNGFTYEGIMEMKFLDKVVQEVLRKYPPIPMVERECTEDYKVPDSNYVIKKGTEIVLSTLGLQRDPEHYPDPEKFDPERFSEEEKSKRHPYTYLPFGEGPRNCIGLRFALLQVKLTLSVLLLEYKFLVSPKTILPMVFDPQNVFLAPKNTVLLDAEKIENN